LNGPLARRSASLAETPASSLLVDVGGNRLQSDLRRLPGARPRYALQISNETPLYLLVSFRVRRGGGERPIAPAEVWVDPVSTADFSFAVSPFEALCGGALVVRLVNGRMQRELVAPLPGPTLLFGVAAGAFVAGVAALGVGLAQPRVDVLAVPPVGVAGAPLQVAYRTGGFGTTGYALRDDRGRTVASGDLRDAAGTLALTLPPAYRTRSYTLQVRRAGKLGVAERAEPLIALPAATPMPRPLIESLSVDRSQVAPGGSIAVRYRTGATHGRVVLRDAQNTVWAQAPLARAGTAQLRVPEFSGNRDLRVTLEAARGNERATSTVGVTVAVPKPSPSAPAMPASMAGTPVRVEAQNVVAGATVFADIAPGTRHVRLALERPDGTALASVEVPDGSTRAGIPVPRDAGGDVVLVVSYDVGSVEESVVRRLSVTPP